MAAWRAGITDIPINLFTDNVLLFCEAKDILSFGCTNKFFALFATDAFWRRKLAVDYNFTGSGTARTSGWKFIYRGLRNPRVFVWGCVTFSFCIVYEVFICSLMYSRALARLQSFREEYYGQIIFSRPSTSTFPNVPFPLGLHPSIRVVSLETGHRSV